MKSWLAISFLTLILFPTGIGFSQLTDKEPTLGITLSSFSPYFYKADDGSIVIIGEVENKKNFPVTGVKIWAAFYDDVHPEPIQSTVGTTILDVIPPNGKSPYMIKSSPSQAITNVSVNLLGFNSSPPKQEGLLINVTSINDSDRIRITGTITNTIGGQAENTTVYLALYDAFEPPRIVSIIPFQIKEKISSSNAQFLFDEKRPQSVTGFKILADSPNLTSKIYDFKLGSPEIISLMINISDVKISDKSGNPIPQAKVGEPILIKSFLRLESQSSISLVDQPYIYYTQIKNSGKQPAVEYIGTFNGTFSADNDQLPYTQWIPEKSGLFFIETFVWDPNGVPLASKGPIILVLVN